MRQIIFMLILLATTLPSCKEIVTSCIEVKQKPTDIRVGVPIDISGLCSQHAESYQWLVADTYSYTGGTIQHTFDVAGTQDVILTINGQGEVVSRKIRLIVLP